jgi:o-succinylbenzoate synthase
MIRRIAWTTFQLPFAQAFTTAHGSTAARAGALIRLTTAEGLEGLGEAAPVPAFGDRLDDSLRVIADLAPHLIGLGLLEADALLARLNYTQPGVAAAACAFDTALYDIRAQRAGWPLARLLGGDAGQPVPVNATIGALEPAAACLAASHATAAGFRCVKLKVGVAGSRQAEIGRVAAVREAIGPDIHLRLDANGAWSITEAIAIIRSLERYDIELVEQPVSAADLAGMAQVRAAVDTPIAADESVRGPEQARQVIAARAAQILVVKPMLAGGLRRALEVVALAREAGLGALVTTTIDAGIGVAAALHLATTLPALTLACGLATGPLLADDLIAQPLIARDGTMRVPDAPGLGVVLDEGQIKRYANGWREVKAATLG